MVLAQKNYGEWGDEKFEFIMLSNLAISSIGQRLNSVYCLMRVK